MFMKFTLVKVRKPLYLGNLILPWNFSRVGFKKPIVTTNLLCWRGGVSGNIFEIVNDLTFEGNVRQFIYSHNIS